MALTRLVTSSISNSAVTSDKIEQQSRPLKITNIVITDNSYIQTSNTSVSVNGGYIVISGQEFLNGCSVLVENELATSVTFVNSSTLRVNVPAKSQGTYNVYVSNPDGRICGKVNGLTYSDSPFWYTESILQTQEVDVPFNINLQANNAVSYSNTSSMPEGTLILSNGYFYGTITGITANTIYNFVLSATDGLSNVTEKRFILTVTV